MTSHTTIAVIGGGILGSAVAYFLANTKGFDGSITVFEPDPTYARSSTARSAAAIRQQFNIPVNVDMSRFSYEFYTHADTHLKVGDQPVDLQFTERGYLTLAAPQDGARLHNAYQIQREHGVDVRFLRPADMQQQMPWLDVEGIGAACLGLHGEGWFDALASLHALRRKAEALGVTYIPARVAGMQTHGEQITVIELANGTHVTVDTVVNAAGAQAARIARMAGVDIPIESRKRCAFVFRSGAPLPDFPNLVDPTFAGRGVFVRAYGENFMAVTSPDPANDADTSSLDVDMRLFDDIVQPALARRVRNFQNIELVDAWAGHYEFNTFDQNAILGPHAELQNLMLLCGFSGHGVMHAPAAGRGIAELIATGAYQTIDLSPLSYERIPAHRPLDDPQASESRTDER